MFSQVATTVAGVPRVGLTDVKDEQIETMRGLACFLLVAFHVIGHDASHGMQVQPDSWYRYAADGFSPLRLPLFTFISGMVYAMRPVDSAHWRGFVRGKLRRLVIPLLVVTSLFIVAESTIIGKTWPSMTELWRPYLFSYAYLWYLQALLLIFFAITIIESCGWLEHRRGWGLIFVLSLGLYLLRNHTTSFFSFASALYLWPFFLSGVAMARYSTLFESAAAGLWPFGLALSLSVLWLAQLSGQIDLPPLMADLLILTVGITAAMSLRLLGLRSRPWALIGGYAYTIYLYHVFGLAAARELILSLIGDHHLLVFTTGMVAGIALPIIGHRWIEHRRLPRLLLLGQRY